MQARNSLLCKVIVKRLPVFSYGYKAYSLYLNQQKYSRIWAGTYLEIDVDAGKHTLQVGKSGDVFQFEIFEGETKYIEMEVIPSFLKLRLLYTTLMVIFL